MSATERKKFRDCCCSTRSARSELRSTTTVNGYDLERGKEGVFGQVNMSGGWVAFVPVSMMARRMVCMWPCCLHHQSSALAPHRGQASTKWNPCLDLYYLMQCVVQRCLVVVQCLHRAAVWGAKVVRKMPCVIIRVKALPSSHNQALSSTIKASKRSQRLNEDEGKINACLFL